MKNKCHASRLQHSRSLLKVSFHLFLCGWLLLPSYLQAQVANRLSKRSVVYRSHYQRIAAGGRQSFEIRSGKIYAWGSNANGKLGIGSTPSQVTSATLVNNDDRWVALSTGTHHTLALLGNGTLYVCGLNNKGQLGDGSTTSRNTLNNTSITLWTSVAAGSEHSIGLKADGTLWAWGANDSGQLGLGTPVSPFMKTTPNQVGTDNSWVMISAGYLHSAAIKSDGSLWTWGDNSSGQLGDNSTTRRNSPTRVGTGTTWTYVHCGANYTMALRADGSLWAWGDNFSGQLGIGNNTNQLQPVRVGTDNNWVMIACGSSHSLALKANGTLWSWGFNSTGQLGNGNTTSRNNPAQVGSAQTWVAVEAGATHSVALECDGSIWAFGSNGFGEVGNGTSSTSEPTPLDINRTYDNDFIDMSAGAKFTHRLNSSGKLYGTGANGSGQLGIGNTNSPKTSFTQAGTDNNWIDVANGSLHTLAIKANGTLWACGYNSNGRLGDGTTVNKSSFVQIGTDDKWVAVACGSSHSLALKSDGTLWAWGHNGSGKLGNGSSTSSSSPIQIGTDNKWVAIAAGDNHSMGLKADGTRWAWGDNVYGQLGDGSNTNRSTPVQIGTDKTWTCIAAGKNHSLALKSNGNIYTNGLNAWGQLGNSSLIDNNSPVLILSNTQFIAISAGNNHSLGLRQDGIVFSWGDKQYGQLGNGLANSTPETSPQLINGSDFVHIGSGDEHSMRIGSVRNICKTGLNDQGQLADGTQLNESIFDCFLAKTTVLSISEWETAKEGTYNYPNPFTDNTQFAFNLAKAGYVNIEIYDLQGKLISTVLKNVLLSAGPQSIHFDGSSLPGGLYQYRLSYDNKLLQGKMVKIKE